MRIVVFCGPAGAQPATLIQNELNPQRQALLGKIIAFNLDAIFEIFSVLDNSQQKILSESIQNVFETLDEKSKNVMVLLTPKIARKIIGF